MAGSSGKRAGGQVVIDIDATLVTAHSDKEGAEPTYKRGYGFHPMCAFVDHGEHGTGETLAIDLRPGKSSAWDSADHIATLDAALAQLPEHERGQVLVRADTGAASKAFFHHITDLGLEYSVGFRATDSVKAAIEAIPEQAWRAAVDGDGEPRDGAQVAELTAWMPAPFRATYRDPTAKWPPGMRVIARRERPHPGAQLRLTDHNGWRITCFATNTPQIGGLAAGRPGSPAPATRPLRGPHPRPEGHRATEPALPRLRPEPDLGRDLRTRCRPARLDPDPRLRPARARTPMGAQTAPVPDPRRRRTHHPHRPPKTPPAPQDWPWNHLIDTGWHALRTA